MLPQILLFSVCVVVYRLCLKFDMSRDNLVGSDKKYHQVFRGFNGSSRRDEFAIVVESQSMDTQPAVRGATGREIAAETNLSPIYFTRATWLRSGKKALLFAPEADLKDMRTAHENYRPFIQNSPRPPTWIPFWAY